MSEKTILVMSTFDSKGEAVELMCRHIRERGHRTLTMDLSVMKEPQIEPDIPAAEVAVAGGGTEADTRGETGNRFLRLKMMTRGAIQLTRKLLEEDKINGAVGFGGISNATMASEVFQSLPIGLPKLILSSGAGMPYNFIGRSDIALVSVVVETDYMNPFLRNSLTTAAHMICGAVESEVLPAIHVIEQLQESGTKVIAVTQFLAGVCISSLIDRLKQKGGYEVVVFHSNGVNDMVMEDLIESGLIFDAVVDLCVAGVSEYLMGGNRATGPTRLDAAGKKGIPQIISPTALDYISSGPLSRRDKGDDPLWEGRKLKERKMWIEDEIRVQVKVSPHEAVEIAGAVAAKLNRARAPVRFLIPWEGWDIANKKGERLYQPEINHLLIDTLKNEVDPKIVEIHEYDVYMDSAEFAEIIFAVLDELMDRV